METDKNKEFLKKQKSYNDFAKYSGLAIQMGVTIGVAIYLGHRLDDYLEFKFPVFLFLFLILSTGGLFYKLYRSVQDDNFNDKL